MKSICVVGSLSYDLVMQVPRRPEKGETIIGSAFNTFVGGKGNNQALAAARSGAPVTMVGKIGADSFGDQVQAKLGEQGVNTEFLFRDKELGTGIADILVEADGSNSISIAPQANGNLQPQDIDLAEPALRKAAFCLMQLEVPLKTIQHAAALAKKLGLIVVLNPAPAPADGKLPAELLSLVDILIPNQSEAELLTGIKVLDLRSAIDAGKKLQEMGVKQVIITMGEQGAMLLDGSKAAHMSPAFEVEAIDSTAAGDAFCGALLAALALELKIEDAITYACAAGALAATKLGAEPSLPEKADVLALVRTREPCLSF